MEFILSIQCQSHNENKNLMTPLEKILTNNIITCQIRWNKVFLFVQITYPGFGGFFHNNLSKNISISSSISVHLLLSTKSHYTFIRLPQISTTINTCIQYKLQPEFESPKLNYNYNKKALALKYNTKAEVFF